MAAALPGKLRFGQGLYFTSNSSKSNDYNGESERRFRSPRAQRVMFLCKVHTGRAFKCTAPSLTQNQVDNLLSQGYESVIGEASSTVYEGTQGALNSDELVVYNNAAAIPSYLIVYEVP